MDFKLQEICYLGCFFWVFLLLVFFCLFVGFGFWGFFYIFGDSLPHLKLWHNSKSVFLAL